MPLAPVAVTHHHPEISDAAGKMDSEVPNEDAVGLRDECDCLLGVEASVKDSAGPLTIERRLRSDPTTLGRNLLEQGEPFREVVFDGMSHDESVHLASISDPVAPRDDFRARGTVEIRAQIAGSVTDVVDDTVPFAPDHIR